MYRMIVIDDERVEREGIIQFIEWKQYDIDIIGEAQNGAEGLQLIEERSPDLVLTDVKMPVMNGIDMIREARNKHIDCIFIVLSGYGDYEYTSQAMLLGVKYYVLKPCDEEGIAKIVQRAQKEIEERVIEQKMNQQKIEQRISRLLPKAKMQFLRTAINNEHMTEKEVSFYENTCITKKEPLFLLVFQEETEKNYLSAFVIENIFEEMVGDNHILMKTENDNHVVFLMQMQNRMKLDYICTQVKQNFKKIFGLELRHDVSEEGDLRSVYGMYQQVKISLRGVSPKLSNILISIKMDSLRAVAGFCDLLFEYAYIMTVFHYERLNLNEMQEGYLQILKQAYGTDRKYLKIFNTKDEISLYECLIEIIETKTKIVLTENETRLKPVLISLFSNAFDRRMSMQWLARQVLYMNEDYLGRIFKNNMKLKFPEYLYILRMKIARRLLERYPCAMLSELAAIVGYSEDGQYFCKVFKKYYGASLTEYRRNME